MQPGFMLQSVYRGGRAYGKPYIFSDFEPSSTKESSGNMRIIALLIKSERKIFTLDR